MYIQHRHVNVCITNITPYDTEIDRHKHTDRHTHIDIDKC